MSHLIILLTLLGMGFPQADSTYTNTELPCSEEEFNEEALIICGSVFAAGAILSLDDVSLYPYGEKPDCRISADGVVQYIPVTAYLALGNGKSGHSFGERALAAGTSYAIMGIIVNSLKLSVNKTRPDASTNNSFPSGHTATAFLGAELVRMEYGGWYGVGAYTLAAMVGVARMYNNRHYLGDVLAGGAIGALSAHLAYWLLPAERKLFRINTDKGANLALMPTSYGISASLFF